MTEDDCRPCGCVAKQWCDAAVFLWPSVSGRNDWRRSPASVWLKTQFSSRQQLKSTNWTTSQVCSASHNAPQTLQKLFVQYLVVIEKLINKNIQYMKFLQPGALQITRHTLGVVKFEYLYGRWAGLERSLESWCG